MKTQEAEAFVLDLLQRQLPANLYYHGVHHVLDVVSASARLAAQEGITVEEDLNLLRTAAFFHDCGFIQTYDGHEEAGCAIARDVLPQFAYTQEQIESICRLIMATQIPQSPQTHLEKILADADLDYLGREDFEEISGTLFKELIAYGRIKDLDAWNKTQIAFFQAHQYWTKSAQHTRAQLKHRHLEHLFRVSNFS
jgi:uncharacterized protein